MGVFDPVQGIFTGPLDGAQAEANARVLNPKPVAAYSPPQMSAPTMANPTLRTVQDNELTSFNLAKLGARGSPLVTQARTNAAESANERGLQNTSMAQQAAEQGVIQSLLPIAGADANTYSGVAAGNQGYQNQFGLANQSAQNQFGLQNNQFGFQGSQSALDRQQAKDILSSNQAFTAGQSALDRGQAMGLLEKNQQFTGAQNEKNQQFTNLQTEKNQAYLSGQAEKDRAARANEFSQTLTKQNEQFYAQQGLSRDQLNWNMQQASTALNTSAFNNYASSITAILDGTNPDKANVIKKVNVIFFGNEDGTGDFKLKLSPNSGAPAPATGLSANPPAENQPAVYDPLLNQSSDRINRNRQAWS